MNNFRHLIRNALLGLCAAFFIAGAAGCKSDPEVVRPAAADSPVRINEIMSSNSYFAALSDGSCYDWIELYNCSDKKVDIRNYGFSDETSRPRKWVVQESCVIEPGEYKIIYMSGFDCVDDEGNFHANFRLSSGGETLLMSSSSEVLLQLVELPACNMENISYGIDERSGNDEFLWMAEPSPGRACAGDTARNSGDLVFTSNGVIINEYMSDNSFTIYDRDSEYSDWIELYNPTDQDVPLAGCSLSDNGVDGDRWYFPDNAVIKSGEYMIVFCSGKLTGESGEIHASFRLSGEDTSLVFFSASGLPMITVDLVDLAENVSYGIEPGSGEWKLFSEATPGRENSTFAYSVDVPVKGTPAGDVVISEILAVSSGSEADAIKCDYIELCNTASQSISLSGYGLSENSDGAEFVFPDVTLGPGQYIAVQCTGKDNTKGYRSGDLTASLKINQGGQTVYLYDPDGHIIDIFDSGKQVYGVTRGRLVNDMSRWHYFTQATPGAANNAESATEGYAPAPVFSLSGGMVEEGFVLRIDSPDGCSVRYTTDGSDPHENAQAYDASKGITISKTTVVRAASYADGCLASQTVTATFFVGADHALPIVSMSTDPMGMFSGRYGIYSDNTTLTGLEPNYKTDIERACTVEYYVNEKRAVSFNAGVRIFGGGSRGFAQKSLALLLKEKYGANSVSYPFFEDNETTVFSSLVLRQAGQECQYSKLRDELMALIVKNRVSCDYMDAAPVALYINGEYWGLYYIREKLNEDYLAGKYGYDKDNVDIIKYERNVAAGTIDDYYDLFDFAEKNDLTKAENYQKICDRVNIDSLIDFWVCETFCANNDTGNIRTYRERTEDGKWGWMLFDVDNGFYQYLMNKDSIYEHLLDPKGHGMNNGCNNVLMRKLLQNEDFRNRFISRYCYHLKNTFDPERTLKMLEELSAKIEPEMPLQFDRWGMPSMETWNKHLDEIRTFLENRPEIVKEHLKKNFGLSDFEFQSIYRAS